MATTRFPAVNCWAIVSRPSGTQRPTLRARFWPTSTVRGNSNRPSGARRPRRPAWLLCREAPAPSAARSVHLWFTAQEAVQFYHEVTVRESQNGTYFAVCGFGHGYFGIQQLGSPREKVAIFSVWDPDQSVWNHGRQDDPHQVPAERQVAVRFHDPAVTVKRFGGEGTGAQSFFPFPWKVGERCRFLIRAEAVTSKRTAYTAYLFLNATGRWKRLATFETVTGGELIRGCYAFVEDFRRDGRSPREARRADFTNGWVQTAPGEWISLTRAMFTADDTPLDNIDAAATATGFTLATGGAVRQRTPLGTELKRLPAGLSLPDWDQRREW